MKKKRTSATACALCITLMLSMAGCSNDSSDDGRGAVVVNAPVSSNTTWIDSSIAGAINEDLNIGPEDDFYTAVNKDWILSVTPDEDNPSISTMSNKQDILDQRLLSLLNEEDVSEAGENPAGIPEDILAHDEDLIIKFGSLASGWDSRNELGAQPVKPYIEAISQITSLEEMTEYLSDPDAKKLSAFFPASITVGPTALNHDTNFATIGMADNLLLGQSTEYDSITAAGRCTMDTNSYVAHNVLERLGYTEGEVDDLLKRCYNFESQLAQRMNTASTAGKGDVAESLEETENILSFDELKEAQGQYPLTEILLSLGYDSSQDFCVSYPDYLSGLGKLYSEQNLENIKAFYIIHTAVDAAPLLDRELFDTWRELEDADSTQTKDDETETSPEETVDTGKETETRILMDNYITPYLGGPMGAVYTARYCTAEQKEQISALIDEILEEYKEIFRNEEWLSEEVRTKSIEKLDGITVRVLYPDEFTDYSELNLENCDNLVDAAAEISRFNALNESLSANTPHARTQWDLSELPTTVVNAYYMPTENSINIFAGYVSDIAFDSISDEELLAVLGMVIGHEITHGFDTGGYLFDKDGYYEDWWTQEDKDTFQVRADKLARYYSSMIPYPGSSGYDGNNVQGEAIADMGGMKCMLAIAEKDPDFDYELFFESYARLWRTQNTYSYESALADDSHPLSYLRVNAVLQQFDKFNEVYDISEEDGMYLSPDKRVLVW